MDKRVRNIAALGLLTIAVTVMLVWGVYFLMGTPFWRSGLDLVVSLENGAGLKRGDPVLVQGVQVGTVRSVDLSANNDVAVGVRLRPDLLLPVDTRASVAGDVFGAHMVDLEPGTALLRLEAGDTIRGAASPQLTDLAVELGAQARNVLASAESLLTSRAVEDVEATAAVLPSTATELRAAFTELRLAATSLRRTAEGLGTVEAAEAVERVVTQIEGSTQALTSAINRLEGSLDSFSSLLAKIDRGEGTLGRLVNDSTLYLQLNTTVREMGLLATDIRERPGRYITLRIW